MRKWKRIHKKRLEFALYQYSIGAVTAGTVLEELRMLKAIDEIEGAVQK